MTNYYFYKTPNLLIYDVSEMSEEVLETILLEKYTCSIYTKVLILKHPQNVRLY